MKLACEWVGSVQQFALPGVGGHHLTWQGPEENNSAKEGGICPSARSAELEHHCHLLLALLVLRPSGFESITPPAPWSPACSWQVVGLFSPHNCVIQFLTINVFIYTYMCVCASSLWVRFLQRTLANLGTDRDGAPHAR